MVESTVGQLCGDDLYRAEVTIEHGDSVLRGKLTSLGYRAEQYSLAGPFFTVYVAVGGITVEGLPLNTPCLISRASEA